ncbi:MAG: hypothetical protein KGS45_06925 [Planctomycetes bacterium]|nr:hypothetical protein [Planctomycetota bacterium]
MELTAATTTPPNHASTALLCESCGYPIGDLPTSSACPECARPISESLPASRPGSPWQNRPGFVSWLDTAIRLIRAPRTLFTSIRITPSGSNRLLFINLSLAGLLAAAPWVGVLWFDPTRGSAEGAILLVRIPILIAYAAVFALVFWILTRIECFGIEFISRRRGWRLLPAAARQVCAHASYGWILAALLLDVGLGLSQLLPVAGQQVQGRTVTVQVINAILALLPGAPPLICFFLGLFTFEWLVYVGVRACRWANPAAA